MHPPPRTLTAAAGAPHARHPALFPQRALAAGLRGTPSAVKRLALKTALTTLTLVCGIGLVTVAGVLVSRAGLRPPLLTLGIPIVVVRSFGVPRALARRADRRAGRDVARRLAGLHPLCLRAGGPPLAALAASAAAVAVAVLVLRPAGVVLATGLAVAGVLLPAAVERVGRRVEAAATEFDGVAGYDRARLVSNRRFDAIRPPAVVRARDASDVRSPPAPRCAARDRRGPSGRPARRRGRGR